jgi:hypothetical protein
MLNFFEMLKFKEIARGNFLIDENVGDNELG